MLNKIKKYLYGFFFGLKNADSEMFSSKHTSNSDSNYIQQIKENNIGKDLLKGEVTQEVEDLRYSTYAVYRESNKYEYIGNGVSVKKENVDVDYNNFQFVQRNKLFCKSIYESLNEDSSNNFDDFTLKFTYNDVSRFKLERYVEYLTIKIVNGVAKLTLRFNKDYDISNPFTKIFYKELMKLDNDSIKINEFNNLSSILFTTFKAQGEDDFIMYSFYNLEYKGYEILDEYVNITYTTNVFNREDLTKKFFSKNQNDKYNKKLSKEKTVTTISNVIDYKCSECGSILNQYDYDITKYEFGRGLCIKCLEKYLTFEK
jgi:hypothetical protein